MSEELVEELRSRTYEIERRIQTYERNIQTLSGDLRVARSLLEFQERDVTSGDYLPHMSPRRLFGRNEIRGFCFEALHAAGGGLDVRELARHTMIRKGMDSEDLLVRKKIIMSVSQTMKTAKLRGFVRRDGKKQGVVVWRLVGDRLPDLKRLRW